MAPKVTNREKSLQLAVSCEFFPVRQLNQSRSKGASVKSGVHKRVVFQKGREREREKEREGERVIEREDRAEQSRKEREREREEREREREREGERERVVLANVPPERKPERGYIRMFPRNENRNEGTFTSSPGTKTRTRVHSPKPPFYETALLSPGL